MHKTLFVAVVAVAVWSCSEKCQDFYSDDSLEADQYAKVGLGYEASLAVAYSGEEVDTIGTVPEGMTVAVSDGKVVVSGTPTKAGEYQLDIRPKAAACEHGGSHLANVVVNITVGTPNCDNDLACRLLTTGDACTGSSTCTPEAPYAAAACIHTLGDAGVCVNVNGVADQCSGAIGELQLTTVEGTQIESCVVTPATLWCNHHVCSYRPDAG